MGPVLARPHCPHPDGGARPLNTDEDRFASLSRTLWSESGKLSFLRLVQRHGKKSSNIADLLNPRTRNDAVQFYYCNKMALDFKRALKSALQSSMLRQDEMKQLIQKTTAPKCVNVFAQPELRILPCSDLDVRDGNIKNKQAAHASCRRNYELLETPRKN